MSDSRHKNSNLHCDRVNSPGPILLPEPDEPTCTTCNGQFASIERFLDHTRLVRTAIYYTAESANRASKMRTTSMTIFSSA